VVSKGDSIKSALKKINQNQYGMILVGEASGKIIGIATDGDIRQALLRGVALEDDISLCANYDFVFADTHSSREQIIKRLDSQIKVIPILD
jgi:CBS domain-containing protein